MASFKKISKTYKLALVIVVILVIAAGGFVFLWQAMQPRVIFALGLVSCNNRVVVVKMLKLNGTLISEEFTFGEGAMSLFLAGKGNATTISLEMLVADQELGVEAMLSAELLTGQNYDVYYKNGELRVFEGTDGRVNHCRTAW